MKVNKNSWHYKLMDSWDYSVINRLDCGFNVTLCQYFWNVVGAILQSIGFVILCGVVVAMGLVVLFGTVIAPINFFLTGFFGVPELGPNGVSFVCLVLFWVALPIIAGVEEYMRGNIKGIPDWMRSTSKEIVKKEKKPNLAWEYIKAKKAKICPLIQLEK